jgi:IS5 family transposase
MKQLTLATVGFERYAKTTRRAAFLAEMERVVPWSALTGFIDDGCRTWPRIGGARRERLLSRTPSAPAREERHRP